MADSASEMESDASSVDGVSTGASNVSPEFLVKRIESLCQENRVLKMEIETLKLKNKALQAENRDLRQASVNIQARAEQEEEYISNTLLKKIHSLKKEKEMLAVNYENEEEFLTNELTRKLHQLRSEKAELEQTLEKEQEGQVKKLLKRIDKLETETKMKQCSLEQLRREKVELENALEQEQEALVNRLWKRMDKLEAEKRMLQERLEQPISAPPSPRPQERDVTQLTQNVMTLRHEVARYRYMLSTTKQENAEKMAALINEEKQIKEENLRLQRKLQLEMERREALCRHLSESESSLEMDDERHFNEYAKSHDLSSSSKDHSGRSRTISSPTPYPNNTTPAKPISPAAAMSTTSPPNPARYSTGGTTPQSSLSQSLPSMSPPGHGFYMSGHSAGTPGPSSSNHNVSVTHASHQPQKHGFAKPPIPSQKP